MVEFKQFEQNFINSHGERKCHDKYIYVGVYKVMQTNAKTSI